MSGGGRFIVFDALSKFLVGADDKVKEQFNLLIGNQEDTKNFSITDEDFLKILQSKGLLPSFEPPANSNADTITNLSFDPTTSELTIQTDKQSFTVLIPQYYKVSTIDERNALILTVGEENLTGSQVFVREVETNEGITSVTYRYDGNESWFAFTNSTGSGSANTTEDILTTIEVGASTANSTIPQGTSFTDYVKLVHQKTFNPTFVNPSFSLSKSIPTLQKVNASLTFDLVFGFNRGSILGDTLNNIWIPSALQNSRAGASTGYTIDGVDQLSNLLSVTKTIVEGLQTYQATVSYAEGPQPLDSLGNSFDSPYPLGASLPQSTSIEGVYPIFANTVNITTATEQSLVSMITGNNIQKTLVAESGTDKQFFDIPNAWLTNRPITKVEFFNTVSNSFDNTNQLNTFTQSSVTNVVESNNINYTRFTNNTSNRGALLIKIIF